MDHQGVAFEYSIAEKSSPMGCLQVGPHQTIGTLMNFTALAVNCRKKFPHCSRGRGATCFLFNSKPRHQYIAAGISYVFYMFTLSVNLCEDVKAI